ncbi:MAG: Rpn family recombination-promoting nuclease/putative transposase [Candidatus Poribacteria bacterium]
MNIHDSGYKKLFSNQTIFRQLLTTFVKEDWVDDLDFESCQTIDKSFISEHYKETESDLLYKVGLKEREIYIYILIEFQSTVDDFMALRVLNYITNFYMDYLTSNKGVKKLPAVFPIVLYNGEHQWTAPVNLKNLIEDAPSLAQFSLDFQYFLIAENQYSKEALLTIRNIVSTLFLAESHYDIDLLETELINLFEAEADKQAVSLLLNWFKQLATHGRIDSSDYRSIEQVYLTQEEVKTMLVTALKKERKEIFEKGKTEGKMEVAKGMLSKGMQISLISEITALPKEQIEQLKSEI